MNKLVNKNSIITYSFSDTENLKMSYKIYDYKNKKFVINEFFDGFCNQNVSDFIAIVHAVIYCKDNNLNFPIYTNSTCALSWIKNRKTNSNYFKTSQNSRIYRLFKRAEKKIKEIDYENQILLWKTKELGKIASYCYQ